MRAGSRKESVDTRGLTSRNDWFDPVNGGGTGNGGLTPSEDFSVGTGGSGGGGEGPFGETTGADALVLTSDCPGGVCPVPWAVKEEPPVVFDSAVNHPSHYNDGAIECIEAIEAALTTEEYRGFLKGNILKYIWREKHKGGTESLKKSQFYLDLIIQVDEAQKG